MRCGWCYQRCPASGSARAAHLVQRSEWCDAGEGQWVAVVAHWHELRQKGCGNQGEVLLARGLNDGVVFRSVEDLVSRVPAMVNRKETGWLARIVAMKCRWTTWTSRDELWQVEHGGARLARFGAVRQTHQAGNARRLEK